MGMNILLTGSEGFIGTHVRQRLVDHDVTRVDLLEPRVHGKRKFITDDDFILASAGKTPYEVLKDSEVLVHLAAQVGVADSAVDPDRYLFSNTMDTSELMQRLETVQNKGSLRKIIVASSMSVYGDGGVRVREDAPVAPTSVYGLTKLDQEVLCRIYCEQNDIDFVGLRFFNVYGPGQALKNPYTGVLANFCNWIMEDKPCQIYEDGQQTRDFIYVDDVADAVAYAVESDLVGTYNVCTGYATTIQEVAEILVAEFGQGSYEITHEVRPGDVRHCTGDPGRLFDAGWKASVRIDEGLRDYVKSLRSASRVS